MTGEKRLRQYQHCWREDEEMDREPRNMSGQWELEKARQWIVSRSPQKEMQPWCILILVQRDSGWISNLQNCKIPLPLLQATVCDHLHSGHRK